MTNETPAQRAERIARKHEKIAAWRAQQGHHRPPPRETVTVRVDRLVGVRDLIEAARRAQPLRSDTDPTKAHIERHAALTAAKHALDELIGGASHG